MAAYVCRRTGIAVLLLFVVSVLVFAATLVLPGNAADQILGRSGTAAEKAQLARQLGLDRSLLAQYGSWIGGILHGDLGHSLASGQAVTAIIASRMGKSLVLAAGAVLVMAPVSLVLGTIAGVRSGELADNVISIGSLGLIAVPEFVSGAVLALVFGVLFAVLPATSIIPFGATPLSDPSILVLPVLALSIGGSAYIIRMVRAGVAETMTADFVEAARLNGIPERRLILRHVLRNSLAASVQVLALTVQWLIGGIVVTETIFGYPGLGQELVQSVIARDIPVVQGVTLLLAAVYIFINLLADVVVILSVPRLRTSL